MRYVAIRSEGGLIPYDLLDKIASEDAAGQKPGDFGLPKGRRLTDEISRVWADAQSLWSNFKRRRESLGGRDPYGTSITRSWIGSLLGDVDMLGFDLKLQASAVVVNNSTYAISHRSGEGEDAIPVHIEGLKIDLDRRLHTKLRTSPQAMLQDFLNNGEQVLWGIATNGLSLRILRDASRTARPTYLEFDLESIFEGNRFNEFALLYRVCHRSRFPRPGQDPAECLLERYYQDSVEQGLRVRDKLREGVEETLKILGTAFLQHPANEVLRGRVTSRQLTAIQFHRQLLLLVYRLLFLMVAEERGLIVSVGENAESNQKIYDEWYSITRLRDRAAQIIDTSPFGDVWQGLQQTFSLFEYGLDTNPLSIPPLNGDLFHQEHAIPDLKGTELYNHELLRAIRHLSLFKDGNVQQRVNYSALDVEELGSVYESLLDYQAALQPSDRGLVFELHTGAERKSTGSYYTRPELVHELVQSSLVPVMEYRIAAAEKASEGKSLIEEQKAKIATILSMTVCDPACGSGHFLLAAARRLGKELARIKTGEDEPKPEDFHLAVRDVISHCVYGVDLNPLAVDLCKLALWLEGHWAGKPLSFLDHRIRCGNSLIGVLDAKVLADGIPDDAFNAVTGDDKKVAAFFKKRNKLDRTSLGFVFEGEEHATDYAVSNRELRELTENTAADVRKKAQMYSSWRTGMQHSHDEAVADLWTAQFFLPLSSTTDPAICTTKDFLEFAMDKRKKPQQVAAAQEVAQQVRFFHWHLEFPEVFENGGFDVVLGNPPWERINIKEKEFFAQRAPEIVKAANKSIRSELIKELQHKDVSLWKEYQAAIRGSATTDKFVRFGGRFPLTACGDINTYGIFAEHAKTIVNAGGRSGTILPIGIATDETMSKFFSHLVDGKYLVQLLGFENEAFIFPSVHHSFKFCAITIAGTAQMKPVKFVFFCRDFSQVLDPRRAFSLLAEDLQLLSPNSRNCPVFRTSVDAQLTTRLFRRLPIFVNESSGPNPWNVSMRRMFHMSDDSSSFRTESELVELGAKRQQWIMKTDVEKWVPLYEAKLIHQFDHRFATYYGATQSNLNSGILPQTSSADKLNPLFAIGSKYWMSASELTAWAGGETPRWLLGFRAITSGVTERTGIFAILPPVAAANSLLFIESSAKPFLIACLLANTNSIVFDYTLRQKIGGSNLTFNVLRQLPIRAPEKFDSLDVSYIVPRVLELTCTSWDLQGFLDDCWRDADAQLAGEISSRHHECGHLGDQPPPSYHGMERRFPHAPFKFEEERRYRVRAELDAYYAHLYGLHRDELRYILDPKDVLGEDFPGETFRVLKEREIKDHGEYRTQRLVLEKFDELAKSNKFRDEMPNRASSLDVPS